MISKGRCLSFVTCLPAQSGFLLFTPFAHAHGTELPSGQSGLLYSMGFVIATGCLHGIGIAIGLIHNWPMGKAAL